MSNRKRILLLVLASCILLPGGYVASFAMLPKQTTDLRRAEERSLPLQLEDTYEPFDPIIIGCNCSVPKGGAIDCQWEFTPEVKYEAVGDPKGCIVHVWAKPGKYKVSVMIVVRQKILAVTGYDEDKKPIIQEMSVIIDYQRKTGNFLVGKAPDIPDPDPDDPVVPTGEFADKIFKASDKVPKTDRDKMIEFVQGDGHKTKKPAKFIIAQIYEGTGEDAKRNPSAWTPKRMRADLDQKLSTLPSDTLRAWRPFFPLEQKAWVEEKLDPSDTKEHASRYLKISEVLQAK